MDPRDVLFVAGNVERLASVKIRCREIATQLGCDCYYDAKDPLAVPNRYKAYICVKPTFGAQGVDQLVDRAAVIWDILDDAPPRDKVTAYIASTTSVARHFSELGQIEVIPHHHCNRERIPSLGDRDKVAYLGSAHWYPDSLAFAHERYHVETMTREDVVRAYRTIGISLNLRRISNDFDRFMRDPADVRPVVQNHILLNSGVKLINCLGFGIPSISSREPAYLEIAPECTAFTDLERCGLDLATLQSDPERLAGMRQQCLEAGEQYHLDKIVDRYRQFIATL